MALNGWKSTHLGILLDDLVDLRSDHRRVLAGLRVVEVVEVLHRLRELLLGLLVQVRDGDTRREQSVVRMASGHRRSHLRGQVVQLDGGDALVDAAHHFQSDFELNTSVVAIC